MRPAFLALASIAALWVGPALPVRMNLSGSAPEGLYWRQRGVTPARDDLVEVCLQGSAATIGRVRGYLPGGTCANGTSPILKQVVAVAGDEVELRRHGFAVNGQIIDSSPRHSVDSLGRSLEPLAYGRRSVRDGEVWVLGIHRERSWDSRYFGAIPVSSIVAIARPLLTLPSGGQQ